MSDLFEILNCTTGCNSDMDDLYTSVIKDCLDKRILILNQEIDEDLVEKIIIHIIRWNIQDKHLQKEDRKPIKIIINSGGGDMFICHSLIDVIENSETPIIGVAVGIVASAAYYILLACHQRVSFKNTTILQHDGGLELNNSNVKAKSTMEFFNQMDIRIKDFVLSHTTMEEDFYDSHFSDEFYMYADDSKKYGIIHKIIGEDISLKEIF